MFALLVANWPFCIDKFDLILYFEISNPPKRYSALAPERNLAFVKT